MSRKIESAPPPTRVRPPIPTMTAPTTGYTPRLIPTSSSVPRTAPPPALARPLPTALPKPAMAPTGLLASGSSSYMSSGLDCRAAIANYTDRIVSSVSGMKTILFDDDTKMVVSMVYTQSQILEKSVFLTASLVPSAQKKEEKERTAPREKMPHLKCIVLCRANLTNVEAIVEELRNPYYGEYHLFFCNTLQPDMLSKIAQEDRSQLVKQVQEYYCDFLAVNSDLFEFGMQGYLKLSRSGWTLYEDEMFRRSVRQMMAVLLSLRQKPTVRYQGSSDLAKRFSMELKHTMEQSENRQLFEFGNQAPPSNSSGETLLLILDRRDDPLTPLLSQWTYQAMVHELLGEGLKYNVVDLGPDFKGDKDLKLLTLSQGADEFYAANMFRDYGALADNTKKILDKYKDRFATTRNIQSVEDMTKFVEDFPEFKKLANNASKHVAVVGELSREIEELHLMDLSMLEQDMATTLDHASHLERVKNKIEDPDVTNREKLRLALLYVLKYETHGGNRAGEIKQLLRRHDINEQMLDYILNYAGAARRAGDLFGAGPGFETFAQSMVNMFPRKTGSSGAFAFENVNQYMRHKPVLAKTLEEARTGRLSESKFPTTSGSGGGAGYAPPARETIVLMLGGTTFEEAALVNTFNTSPAIAGSGFKVLLGGTCIHNSKSFVYELNEFGKKT